MSSPELQPDSAKDALNPTDISWQALAPALSLSSVALALVILRWYTRLLIVRKVGPDDIMIAFSGLLSVGMTVVIAIQFFQKNQVTVGQNEWGDFTIVIAPIVAKLVLVNNVLYIVTTNLTKASIVVQYLRLFRGKWMRRACWVTLCCLFAAAMYGIFAGIFICVPIRKFWRPGAKGHCLSAQTVWLGAAGINIVMDWTVWIIPMPTVSRLRLPRRQMIGVFAVFALGGFICATSIARLTLVHIAAVQDENTRASVGSVTWSAIEANVGIICACLMAMKPLVTKFFPNLLIDKQPPSHHMRLPVIEQNQYFWAGSSMSTTCAASEMTTMTTPPAQKEIKVTTETTTISRPSSVISRLTTRWPYNAPLGTLL
ncbi:hypothetical protein NA57DRAFT_78668 [Rhizodiscina lignyota]|uniref:Rhodopsin domain-containing protein n=1 Tax=Rhizodiscina lignyota TaxID=1504668 RepID=A0A9P4M3M6_9PEZI|nr:hypothetical protein NA57DRAFT_78668 [Rhizodiscina lignyota]